MRPLDPQREAEVLVASGFVAPERRAALAAYLAALRVLDELGRGRGDGSPPERAEQFRSWLSALEGLAENEAMRPLLARVRELAERMTDLGRDWRREERRHADAVGALRAQASELEPQMLDAIEAMKRLAHAARSA